MTTTVEVRRPRVRPLLPRVRRPTPGPGRARIPQDRGRTAILTATCFTASLLAGLQQWSALHLGGFDLGIFDQGIRGYAHLRLPVSGLKSYHHEFPPGFSLLGDHFSPVLALLAPLYRLWDDPRVLIVAQAGLFAAGVPLARRIAAHCFAAADTATRRRAADLAGLVHALGWPLLVAARAGFHEVAFAVPLTLLMLERGLARRYTTTAVAALLLCATKEDLGLAVGVYGLVLAARSQRHRDGRGLACGAALAVAGPVASALAIGWLIPAMGGRPGYYWNYGSLGPDAPSAAANLLHDPLLLVHASLDAPLKPLLVLWLLGTMLALPLRSATVLCALPLLAERILSDNPNHWSVARHYDAFLWPFLLTAALETAGRLCGTERTARAGRRLAGSAAAVLLAASTALALVQLAVPGAWRPSAGSAGLVHAASLIPDVASVEADNAIAPRLTARTDVVLVDGTPRGRDWVLIHTGERTFPFLDARRQADRVVLLLAHGYRTVWTDGDTVLLHRTTDEPVPGESVPGPGSTPVQEVVPPDVGHDLFLG